MSGESQVATATVPARSTDPRAAAEETAARAARAQPSDAAEETAARPARAQPADAPPAWEVGELAAQNALFERRGGPAEDVLAWLVRRYRSDVVLACSFGVEDCVLVDMVSRHAPSVGIFYLDTQLHFPETYATRDRLVARYGIRPIQVLPRLDPEQQAARDGPALWRRDPDACCRLRKVEPLRAFLAHQRAWISGVRREQSPTRAHTPWVGWDDRFGLVKASPLADWTAREVWAYVHEREVPYNPLHDAGFPSIGCWPCTRAVRPGEDARAGRWAGLGKTECGLHQ